ncbi:hypothetical protein FRB96_005139 [Tulasnella sp. 330]|nr:hypothetical protein FRB96_005139 [Tulasnella sp. 330]KAG8878889.1 hypothetical protein FRB97_002126 [Tulasnella sp. 331]KAG8887261.1 hypothetical protein FRB98_000298 [Tulasnella sp. 332]
MDIVTSRVPAFIQSLKETRLSGLRPVTEFFDHNRLSRPADLNTATSRISYNTRYFSGNYAVIIAALAVYALLTNLFLVFGLLFFVGGFAAINKFGADPLQVGDHVVTQKSLYIGLFVIGVPLLYLGAPLSTFFWLVGASSVLILGHASLIEPGVESEYGAVQEQV